MYVPFLERCPTILTMLGFPRNIFTNKCPQNIISIGQSPLKPYEILDDPLVFMWEMVYFKKKNKSLVVGYGITNYGHTCSIDNALTLPFYTCHQCHSWQGHKNVTDHIKSLTSLKRQLIAKVGVGVLNPWQKMAITHQDILKGGGGSRNKCCLFRKR